MTDEQNNDIDTSKRYSTGEMRISYLLMEIMIDDVHMTCRSVR